MPSSVSKDLFYEKLTVVKSSKKGNSKLTAFTDDEFYQNAKTGLKNENTTHEEFELTKTDVATIKRKQWTIFKDNIIIVQRSKKLFCYCTQRTETKLRTL